MVSWVASESPETTMLHFLLFTSARDLYISTVTSETFRSLCAAICLFSSYSTFTKTSESFFQAAVMPRLTEEQAVLPVFEMLVLRTHAASTVYNVTITFHCCIRESGAQVINVVFADVTCQYVLSGIYTTINFTYEFRSVSVTIMCLWRKWAWLAGCGGRGRHALSIVKQTSI